MKAALFAYSRQGCRTAALLAAALSGDEIVCFCPERHLSPGFQPIPTPSSAVYAHAFNSCDALIFISSCGIAVRMIAPHIKSKTTDPAVVCIDEAGHFAISLLSGHLGGANALAAQISVILGAVPVITTATDIHKRFSVDSWAKKQGFSLSDMGLAKEVSAGILEKDIPFMTPYPVIGALPAGIRYGDHGPLGIYIGHEILSPFEKTLRLVPKNLTLGIGCRKGTAGSVIEKAVTAVLSAYRLDPAAVKQAASIDLKSGEPGLRDFCQDHGLPIIFFTPEELSAISGSFNASGFVKKITGVDNVCERAAVAAGGDLLVEKTAAEGVTVAVSIERTEIHFG